jgi:phage-related protein (TIGR01555 family)
VHGKTKDSFQNFAASLGIGTNNLSSAAGYGFNPVTRNRTALEWVHRGSWLGGVAIDVVADDMTKRGVEIRGDMDPEDIEHLDRAATTLGLWNEINDTVKWSRLYGGAIGFMMIDGQKSDTPLRLETVGKNQFKGLLVLDRWMVEPSLNDLVTEQGPDVGLPKFYTVTADAPALPHMKIHYSRCLRLEGVRLPYWQRLSENLWGISVLERLWDRMVAFDSATQGAAQLVYKAYLRTYHIKGLREVVAAGGSALDGLVKQIAFMRQTQSLEGITLLDAEDEFATFQYSFSGLSDVILQFGQQLAGALQIPLVRLFGQSPAGLNSTGESDLRTYYDGIQQQQEKVLRVPVTRFYRALAQSEGIKWKEGVTVEFKPLWQLTDVEKVSTAGALATTVGAMYTDGVIERSVALEELKQGSKLTGVFTNVTDEMIKAAEDEPPPGSLEATAQQMQLQNEMAPEPEEAPGAKKKQLKGKTKDKTKHTHEEVKYEHPSVHKGDCSKCVHFIASTAVTTIPHCEGVVDPIRPEDFCSHFELKEKAA